MIAILAAPLGWVGPVQAEPIDLMRPTSTEFPRMSANDPSRLSLGAPVPLAGPFATKPLVGARTVFIPAAAP